MSIDNVSIIDNTPTPEQLDIMLEEVVEMLKEAVFSDDMSAIPPFVVVRFVDHGKIETMPYLQAEVLEVPEMPEEQIDRQHVYFRLGQNWAENRPLEIPLCTFAVTEIWMGESEDTTTLPSDQPDRKEGVLIAGTSIDKYQNAKMFSIKRTPENGIVLKEQQTLRAVDMIESDGETALQDNVFNRFFHGYLAWISRNE